MQASFKATSLAFFTTLLLTWAPSHADAQRGARTTKTSTNKPAATRKAKVATKKATRVRTRAPKAGKELRGEKVKAPTYRTAAQAAGQIRAGANVYVPIGHSVAKSVLKALGQRETGLSAKNPIKIVGLTNTASKRLFSGNKIIANSVFIGANNRDAIAAGRGDFVPVHLSRVAKLIGDKTLPIDVVVIQVSPPDKNGMVSLGPTAGATLAAMKVAKKVIAEVNPNVPRTFGATRFHQSKIDFMVKSDAKISTIEPSPPSKTDVRIAKHVMGLIPRSPTLQFGIGTTTDAVAGLLASSGRKDLKIHSEMISDGAMKLVKSGAVRGKVVYSFALGSQKMLNWMDNNKKLEAQPSDVTNSIVKLAQIPKLISINTALRVDLAGQVNAQYVGNRNYSGIGGQQDFFRGAMLSPGGKAILTLPSTSKIKQPDGSVKLVSKITFQLGKGDLVTTGMHDVQFIVTEYGIAHLDGKNMTQRAEALIKIAHPKFRKGLRTQLRDQAKERKAAVQLREQR
ncbi:MAG: acetyl-CoA hydrolase/transferase family protein [Kofleriaceae bacterium]|nr:acetyl-CoA hydrolase/transferase family protein [Kofleriaceae bacterium]